MINKTLTVLAVTFAASMAFATVGAFQGSSQGSSDSLTGSGETLWESAKIVVNSAQGAVVSALNMSAAGSTEVADGTVFLVEHPIQASENTAAAGVAASTWVVTTTGHVLQVSGETAVKTIQDPLGESRTALTASQEGITVTVDASGRVMTASGAYLKDKFNKPVQLAMKGTGEIYTATAGTLVYAYHASATEVSAVGVASVTSTEVASAGVRKAFADMYAASSDSFAAARKAYQNKK